MARTRFLILGLENYTPHSHIQEPLPKTIRLNIRGHLLRLKGTTIDLKRLR